MGFAGIEPVLQIGVRNLPIGPMRSAAALLEATGPPPESEPDMLLEEPPYGGVSPKPGVLDLSGVGTNCGYGLVKLPGFVQEDPLMLV